MDLIGDGKTCEQICKYAPPENKWPCIDCDIRWHDRAEPKIMDKITKYFDMIVRQQIAIEFPQKCACCPYMFQFKCQSDEWHLFRSIGKLWKRIS